MLKERVPETSEGIQSEVTAGDIDTMQKGMRDKNRLITDLLTGSGIISGKSLEIGPGPGYLGLEWLSKTSGTKLTGLEISPAMIEIAEKNAIRYGLLERAEYISGSGLSMPFPEESFDNAFSNGSLHEWEDPKAVFSEIYRVLKPGGTVVISDLKRDTPFFVMMLLKLTVRPKRLKSGLLSSVAAAYTAGEMPDIIKDTGFSGSFQVSESPFGLTICAKKEAGGA